MIRVLDSKNVIFLILFVAYASFFVLIDPDYYLHLMAGKYIMQHLALPNVDVFSYTMAGRPWQMHEWLFEVMVYGVHFLGGDRGVALWTSGVGVLAFFLIFRAGVGHSGRPYRAILFGILVFIVYAQFIKPRPQIISFFCFGILLSVLFDYKYRHSLRYVILLPPVMVLWANSHGAYIFGIGFLWVFMICEYLRHWSGSDEEWRGDRLGRLVLAGVATVAASSINPYWINHWLFPFALMNKTAMGVISEWRSPDFHELIFKIYLAILGLFVLHYMYLKKRPDLTELVLPGLLIFGSFVSLRHIPFAILTMLAFGTVTAERGYEAKTLLGRVTANRGSFQGITGAGRPLGRKEYIFNGVILCAVIGLFLVISPELREKEREERSKRLPVKAVDFILRNGIKGRCFNTYRYGGYLIYRLFPAQKVFIDIRADMYGDEFIRDYTTIYFGGKGWEGLFDGYKFDYVICEKDAVIRKLLVLRGDFQVAYSDAYHSVLLPKEGRKGES